MSTIFLIAAIMITLLILIRIFRKRIIQWLLRLRAKLQIQSLRKAIWDADKDKEKTDRKNLVVFNLSTGKYEPIQKKLLKIAANVNKNKNNAAMTEGRKRFMKKRKERSFDPERIRTMEQKSLYVTK